MKRRSGFTMIEMMIVLAIMSILFMIAVPSLKPIFEYDDKNRLESMKNIIVDAIDYWSKDNIDSSQRPANFESENSQGKKVYEYIMNKEIYSKTNLKISRGSLIVEAIPTSSKTIGVDFRDGVLKLALFKNGIRNVNIQAAVPVIKEDGKNSDYQYNYDYVIPDYESKKRKNIILYGSYKAIDVKK